MFPLQSNGIQSTLTQMGSKYLDVATILIRQSKQCMLASLCCLQWCLCCFVNADVTIVVDETSRNMSVTEGETISVCARTMGRADFVISASLQPLTVPGSAMADEDFAMESQQLSFPPNSAEPQCVSVEATDNNVLERSKEFTVVLVLTEGQNSKIMLGAQTTASITIIDNDCELTRSHACHVLVM